MKMIVGSANVHIVGCMFAHSLSDMNAQIKGYQMKESGHRQPCNTSELPGANTVSGTTGYGVSDDYGFASVLVSD